MSSSVGRFDPIAIVGYGCVFPPDATDTERYWQNLLKGVSGIGLPTADRWSWELYFDEDRGVPEKTYCRYGGFVRDYEFPFQALAAEHGAPTINRTQQFALDASVQALARTRRGRAELTDSKSMLIMANMLGDETWSEASLNYRKAEIASYLEDSPTFSNLDEGQRAKVRRAFLDAVDARFPRLEETPVELLLPTALPRVVARVLGVRGPSFLVDGACAGGLMVVDTAIRYLHDRSADVVVAVAVMANMSVTGNVAFAKIGGLSPDASRPLNADANGLIPSEGAGTVILKRLSDALTAGDEVIAVIRGVASRTDGKGKAIYAPNSRGQVDTMRRALALAGWTLRDVDHVETHATATAAGDKVELASLVQLVNEADPPPAPRSISVGSVKALIGHSFPAAGMANLIKILASFEHQQLAPTHHVTAPQPVLRDPSGPFVVHGEPGLWPADRRRRALANAFGFGGVNASICVEGFDAAYHRALLERREPVGSAPTRPRSGRAAIVGAAVRTAAARDLATLAGGGEPAPGGYPVGRGHRRAQEIYDPNGRRRVHAIDFEFPWREYRIPPDTLAAIDRAQQLALVVAGQALKDAGRRPVPQTAVLVGAFAGLEAATTRNLLIRAVEFEAILERVWTEHIGGDRLDTAPMAAAVRAALGSYISPTTESALPGYMDNIVPGRIGNMFDLRAANVGVDAGHASFAVALDLGLRALRQGECEELLVGGVSANLSDELTMAVANDGKPGVPAEAAAFFLLKPVEEITAEDHVYAIVDGVDLVADPVAEAGGAHDPDYFGAAGAIRLATVLGAGLGGHARTVPAALDTRLGYEIRLSAADRIASGTAMVEVDGPEPTGGSTANRPEERRVEAAARQTVTRAHGVVEAAGVSSGAAERRVWRGLTLREVGDLLATIASGAVPEDSGSDGGTWSVALSWRSPAERSAKAKAALKVYGGT